MHNSELITNDSSDYGNPSTTTFCVTLHQCPYLNSVCIHPPVTGMQFQVFVQYCKGLLKHHHAYINYLFLVFFTRCGVIVVRHDNIGRLDDEDTNVIGAIMLGICGEAQRSPWCCLVAQELEIQPLETIVCFTVHVVPTEFAIKRMQQSIPLTKMSFCGSKCCYTISPWLQCT